MNRSLLLILPWLLLVCLAGCFPRSGSTASADIRYRVFEVSPDAFDEVLPPETRTQVADSKYFSAPVAADEIAALVKGAAADTGVLVDQTRPISWWPKTADTWSYSKADGKLLGGGTGSGFLGVRTVAGSKELRIEYNVTHSIQTAEPISTTILYEGSVPEEGLLFAMPFQRSDGTPLVHVIAFEVSNWQTKEPAKKSDTPPPYAR